VKEPSFLSFDITASRLVPALFLAAALPAGALDPAPEPAAPGLELRLGFEAKAHFRDSDQTRLPTPFFVGGEQVFMETVSPGRHLELSVVSLFVDAVWGEHLAGRVKLDFLDLHDRNPTSTDRNLAVDELWLRFGRETLPGFLPPASGAYLKLGKFGRKERQDDRHLESYGLAATAFNRFEDVGLEAGVDLGRRVYIKGSLTQGNPLFMRDPNALAGDHGTPARLDPGPPQPALGTGIPILYDARVEDFSVRASLQWGVALGLRLGGDHLPASAELMLFGYRRELADTVPIHGSRYGGDLDLLLGPGNLFPFPIEGRRKEEVGANLWVYWGGFSFFGQYVDQEVAGLERVGWEAEVAWSFDLPLRWALAERQLFPSVAPAVRYSFLDPRFEAPLVTPSPSLSWEWSKLDAGVRLGIVPGIDLTVEYARNHFILRDGRAVANDELLTSLRWRT
jgi:hypothetical protein